MSQNFPVKTDLPKPDQAELDRINAISDSKRSAGESAYLASRLQYLTNTIIEFDADGNILRCSGNTVPADGLSGFSKGCLFIEIDAVASVVGIHENIGTISSCNFTSVQARYVDASGDTMTGPLTINTIANPGLIVGNGIIGYLKIGDFTINKRSANFFSFNNDGVQGINNLIVGQDSPDVNKPLFIKNNLTASKVVSTFQGASGQTGNLAEWNVNGGAAVALIDPTGKFDSGADTIRVRTSKTPALATTTGNAGDIAWDSGFVYVCVATNTWKRAAIATW